MTVIQNIRQAFDAYMVMDLALVEGHIITRNGADCHGQCKSTGAVGIITGIRAHRANNGHIIMMRVTLTHEEIEIIPSF
jgi:hypothetical protein